MTDENDSDKLKNLAQHETNHQFTLETKPSKQSRPPIPRPEQIDDDNNSEKPKN